MYLMFIEETAKNGFWGGDYKKSFFSWSFPSKEASPPKIVDLFHKYSEDLQKKVITLRNTQKK